MKYDKIDSDLTSIECYLEKSKIKLAPDAEMVLQMELVREFLLDKAQLSDNDLWSKWNPKFKSFYDAQLAVGLLGSSITELVANQNLQLDGYLKKIMGGSITQGGDPELARDLFYELWLASHLSISGFRISLQEPDIVIEGNGLSKRIGIACKYPSSEKQIHSHISKGYSQLGKQGLPGFVALGVDQIVVDQMGLKNYVDFNQTAQPIQILEEKALSMTNVIVEERPIKFPEEEEINELLVTLSIGGVYGRPAKLTVMSAAVVHSTNKCLILPEMRTIHDSFPTTS